MKTLLFLAGGLVLVTSCAMHDASEAVVPAAMRTSDDRDPPGRAARLSFYQGPVSMRESGSAEWTPVYVNRPVTNGDSLWTDSQARAELTFGNSALRLDANTSVQVRSLDDLVLQVQLTGGVIQFQIRDLVAGEEVEVNTPAAAISLLRPGGYRIEVHADTGVTRMMVRAGGLAEVLPGSASARATAVRSGEETSASTGAEIAEHVRRAPPLFDDFDQFCENREKRLAVAARESRQYVPPGVVGWEDLDEYGVWSVDPAYGAMWAPRVVTAGWVPYRFGRWVWILPWGWTWIDDYPWGFAPFHYGRWLQIQLRWWWIPGPRLHRVCFSPALVVFVGTGSGPATWRGWFPLGPREVYVPPYRSSPDYVARINRGHTPLHMSEKDLHRVDPVRQVYRNRDIHGAVTRSGDGDFRGGSGGRAAPQSPRRDRGPTTAEPRPPVQRTGPPAPASRPSRPEVTGPKPPARIHDRPVVTRPERERPQRQPVRKHT
jgi:hypothetical protein